MIETQPQLKSLHMATKTDKEVPHRLYKYRHFDDLTLEALVDDMVYFADPTRFNDPLDTRPALEVDVGEEGLAGILRILVEQRARDEMSTGLKTGKVRGPRVSDHIERHSRSQAEEILREVEYYATDPDGGDLKSLLGHHIEQELLRRYRNGIFCLAERATCPLMWSHYGDRHRGICIGYSVPDGTIVHEVKYGGSRLIEASEVAAMLKGSEAARRRVDEAVLLRKARPWRYEREWRLIGRHGLQDSTLELEEVVFGVRCSRTVKYTLLKALEGRERQVEFSEIRETRGSYPLKKRPLDCPEELTMGMPRRSLTVFEDFPEVLD